MIVGAVSRMTARATRWLSALMSMAAGPGATQNVGDGFVVSEKPCHFEMSGAEATKPTISDDVPLSLEPVVAAITFEEAADGTLTYQRAETTQLIGVRLDNPATDPLPTEAYDERIFDQEGDGKPGATATIAGGIDGGQMDRRIGTPRTSQGLGRRRAAALVRGR